MIQQLLVVNQSLSHFGGLFVLQFSMRSGVSVEIVLIVVIPQETGIGRVRELTVNHRFACRSG